MSDALTPEVAALVRLSARIAIGSEFEIRAGCAEVVAAEVPTPWVEECILQSYLMAGFPRTLNAMREWRRVSGVEAPEPEEIPEPSLWRWRQQGEQTCEIVYGKFYTKLRENIAHLHPALDEWMIVEGYGKILSRPGLELKLRELCIVAACAAMGQDRQLHSHLHGAVNAGATGAEVAGTLAAIEGLVEEAHLLRARLLWARVHGKA
ncbi:MAG: carboxymuconolactone decarboxylase family protein [Gemmatimonadaceae bacterium]|nr:carboxymuconolactone decarboxylase family protein [Gemmatimonadaceae bacterium]MCW5825384.1 carboxymuconolactone decarboxylase family protein [Gemmatimonadaceae bacterium]